MQLEDRALQLMLLAAEGLPGGWAGLDWTRLQDVLGVRTDGKIVLLPGLFAISWEGQARAVCYQTPFFY